MKTNSQILSIINHTAANIGLTVMTLATVVGMMELPSHGVKAYVLPGQTVKFETGSTEDMNNPLRREKEETNQEYVSYSQAERTAPRSRRI